MKLEPAAPRDLAAIVNIERRSFTDPWSVDAFANMIGASRALLLVAREDAAGPVLGYVVAIFAVDEGEVANLAVAEEARGRGIGSALVDAALAEGGRRGTDTLYLEVRESNEAARRLYLARGFEEVGRRRGYYQRPAEDALILRRLVGAGLK